MTDNMQDHDAQQEQERGAFDTFVHHQRRALEETGRALEALLPEGFRSHSAEARKEFGKGFRVLVDAALSELDKISKMVQQPGDTAADDDDDDRPSTTGKTKVKVQVD